MRDFFHHHHHHHHLLEFVFKHHYRHPALLSEQSDTPKRMPTLKRRVGYVSQPQSLSGTRMPMSANGAGDSFTSTPGMPSTSPTQRRYPGGGNASNNGAFYPAMNSRMPENRQMQPGDNPGENMPPIHSTRTPTNTQDRRIDTANNMPPNGNNPNPNGINPAEASRIVTTAKGQADSMPHGTGPHDFNCASGVRQTFNRLGIHFNSIGPAKNYANALSNDSRFEPINFSNKNEAFDFLNTHPGYVGVYGKSSGHPNGHVFITDGQGGQYSDRYARIPYRADATLSVFKIKDQTLASNDSPATNDTATT